MDEHVQDQRRGSNDGRGANRRAGGGGREGGDDRGIDDHNLLVSKMRLVPPPKVSLPAPTEDVGALDYATPGRPSPAAPTRVISTPSPANHAPVPIPTYAALAILTLVLRVIGATAVVIAGLIFLLVIFGAVRQGRDPGPAEMVVLIPTVGGPLVTGLILFAIGELLSCVRDMAINSFRQLLR